jgi:cytochrome bd ubiquinol oxidase subunit I
MLLASELLAARNQMALSLGFHIVLSCFGVAFPALIYVVHRRGIKRNDPVALALAKKWSKVAAVLFAVGAVSGTVLSFEMGLLWPGLMSRFGDVIGLPFAMEGIAFFVEAVFIGIYLYGWDRLPPRVHLATLIPINLAGLFGTFCILSVNAWMNSPSGFDVAADGSIVDIDPLAAMFNRSVLGQFLHMYVAAFIVVGFLVASVYAVGMRRGRDDHAHRLGLRVSMSFAAVAALVQPGIGHVIGLRLATEQPSKLAAMELATETETNAPVVIGGLLIDGEVRYGLEVPGLGSLLARGGLDREIVGFDEIPDDEEPPANIVHLAFQTMVGIGTALVGLSAWFWWSHRRGRTPSTWLLRALAVGGVAAVTALEAGWVTTEVGRQPWIVYGVLRTEDAVTDASGIWITFGILASVYVALGVGATLVLRSMARRWRESSSLDLPTPYGPKSSRAAA